MNARTGLTLCVVLAVAAGCAPYPIKRAKGPPLPQDRIIMLDRASHKALRLASERVEKAPDGRMNVKLLILNPGKDGYWAEIKASFIDARGEIIMEDAMHWEPVLFPAGERTALNYRSLSDEAVDYRITIREKEEQP